MPCFIKLTDQSGQKIRVNMDLVERYHEALRPNYAPRDVQTHSGTDLIFFGPESHPVWVKQRPSEIDNLITEWEERG